MPLQTRLSALITAIKADLNAIPKPLFPIWAEENGAIAADAYEWSFGNGATGADIGIPLPVNCQIEHITLNADVPGTSATMRIYRNLTEAFVTPAMNNNGVYTLPTPEPYVPGDFIMFRTGTLVGSWTDVRVCAWFRET